MQHTSKLREAHRSKGPSGVEARDRVEMGASEETGRECQAEAELTSMRFLALKTSPISQMMISSLVLPSPSKWTC